MRMNACMRRLISAGLPYAPQLHPSLVKFAERGLVRIGDCIVFRGERDNGSESPDSTGYESSANHIDIDDFVSQRNPSIMFEQAVALAAFLNQQLRAIAPNLAFRYIISLDSDGGCTFRFHTVRGEEWDTNDLEGYKEEAIAVIESSDL